MSRRWLLLLTLSALGCDMPRDPQGTFDRVRGGTMRVGVSGDSPWVSHSGGDANGIEAALVKKFADQIGAEIDWQPGGESELFHKLQHGGLDLVIGGLVESTPWSKHVGLTRPYLTTQDEKHVMAVRQGENRWLLELEKFLYQHRGEAMHMYQQAPQT
jgi:ABC-type amino acid transport substrate-binding protein